MTLLQQANPLKKTPLCERHEALGAKMTGFAGWLMPVYYSGIIAEHLWTRKSASVFDVSHLGEFHVSGAGAFDFLQARLTNDLNKLKDGKILYSLLCDEMGGMLDDILIYQEARDDYYLIVNASNIARDFEALTKYAPDSVSIKDRSDDTACLAIQGPKSEAILEKLFGLELKTLGYYSFKEIQIEGAQAWISRSGYTGEDGFEIFLESSRAAAVWDRLIGDGKAEGILPAGLGARNTLRLEAGNALYGNDLDPGNTPLEAGLGWAVSFHKGAFVGRDRLLTQKERGPATKLVGFRMLDRAIAREHYPIFKDGNRIGRVTSGSFGPSVGGNIGLGYVQRAFEIVETKIDIEIHGRLAQAEVVSLPFIELKHKNKK